MSRLGVGFALLCLSLFAPPSASYADEPQESPPQFLDASSAILIGLNKRSGQAKSLSAKVGESVIFESLSIRLVACKNVLYQGYEDSLALLQISEKGDGSLFQGWMFRESPSLNSMNHSVYSVWLKECVIPKAE